MAERPTVLTQHLTRDKLAKFLTSQEAIKAFENITRDVSSTLPDAVESNSAAIETAQSTADAARIVADEALTEVEQSQIEADTARILASTALAAARIAIDASELAEHLLGQVAEQREQIAALSRRLDDLEQRPTP